MRIATIIKSIPFFGFFVLETRRRYYQWKFDPQRHIRRALCRRKRVYVVQIGSNDGRTGDPIHQLLIQNPSWNALLVEPVPFLFERLRRNYPDDPRFRFENVAIADQAGISAFYYIDAAAKDVIPNLPQWFDQLGSFDRSHINRHLGDAVDRFIVSAAIPTLPLSTVLGRNNVDIIDLLHIDTEGYDWLILRQIDLSRYQPEVILFEHRHLSAEAKNAARQFLRDTYKIIDLGCDYFCRRR